MSETKERSWLARAFGRRDVAPQGAKSVTGVVEFSPRLVQAVRLGTVGNYGAIYRSQPAVRTVVDFLSNNIAQIALKTYQRVSPTDRPELNDHPLTRLLGHPNPQTTRFRMMRDTVRDLALYDRAYWLKVSQGRQQALVRLPPAEVEHRNLTLTAPQTFQLTRNSTVTDFDAAQIVYFRGYSADEPSTGTSPLETLRTVLEEEAASMAHRRGFWRNAARRDGIIERPADAPDWSADAKDRFREDWYHATAGVTNAGRAPVLEDGMKWNPDSFSPHEAEYIEGRKLTREEVARAYGIPLPMVGILEHATLSNVTEQHKNLYQDTLGPWLRMIQDEIDMQLVPDFTPNEGVYVEFNIAEKLRGAFEEQAAQLTSAIGGPYMTRNEGRARLNLPRIKDPEADELIVPMNVSVGGQPAPNVPLGDGGDRETAGIEPATKTPERERRLEQVLRKFFQRQGRVVMTAAGLAAKSLGPRSVDDLFDTERWDSELGADLFALGLAEYGDTAKAINATTRDGLAGAGLDTAAIRKVFTQAADTRAEQLAHICA